LWHPSAMLYFSSPASASIFKYDMFTDTVSAMTVDNAFQNAYVVRPTLAHVLLVSTQSIIASIMSLLSSGQYTPFVALFCFAGGSCCWGSQR
jgi:hypothetical protein